MPGGTVRIGGSGRRAGRAGTGDRMTIALPPARTIGMARTYTHVMSFHGATGETDTEELRRLMRHAADLGLSARSMEEALCVKTGFEEAVRTWIHETRTPNGVVRRIILNGAREIVGSVERGGSGSPG